MGNAAQGVPEDNPGVSQKHCVAGEGSIAAERHLVIRD